MAAGDTIELGLVSLYHALDPDEFDLAQLGEAEQIDTLSVSPNVALRDLAEAVNLDSRRDRYGANLAYVLARRCVARDIADVAEETVLLGQTILSPFEPEDPVFAEQSLGGAVNAMLSDPHLTEEVARMFVDAFGPALTFDDLGDFIVFEGAAAETATMFSEMSCMAFGLSINLIPGTVTVGRKKIDVFKFDYEICTPLSWARLKVVIDPRQWPVYNPGFFHSVQVLDSRQLGNGPDWCGEIQESVGVMPTNGKPAITNLNVTYYERPDVAVTVYDLGPDVPGYPDDGNVTVDYGFFGVVDEGAHRRMRMVKVLHIDGFEKVPKWVWWLWAQQISLSGYLIDEPNP